MWAPGNALGFQRLHYDGSFQGSSQSKGKSSDRGQTFEGKVGNRISTRWWTALVRVDPLAGAPARDAYLKESERASSPMEKGADGYWAGHFWVSRNFPLLPQSCPIKELTMCEFLERCGTSDSEDTRGRDTTPLRSRLFARWFWRASIRLAGAFAFAACLAEDARLALSGEALPALVLAPCGCAQPFFHVERAELRLACCGNWGPGACRPVGGRLSLSSRFLGGETASSLVVPMFGGLLLHR